jgi:hypothetical protein
LCFTSGEVCLGIEKAFLISKSILSGRFSSRSTTMNQKQGDQIRLKKIAQNVARPVLGQF